MIFVFMAKFAWLVFVPLELESLRGETAFTVGLLFFPQAAVTAVAMSLGGRLVDRIGPRLPILIGCATLLIASLGVSRLTITTSLLVVCALLSLQGFGIGLISAPALVAGLSDLPRELVGQGAALRSLATQVSGALAVATFGAIVAVRMGTDPSPARAQSAYNSAFVAVAVGVALSLLMASRLPSRRSGAVAVGPAVAVAAE
jgi:MFS family permease